MNLEALLKNLEEQGKENDAREIGREDKLLNITRDTGEFISTLIKASNSSSILEIGTSNGYSTLWLASSINDGGKVKTVEISAKKVDMARRNFESAKLQNKIDLICSDFIDFMKSNQEQYDLVFLDSDRTKYISIENEIISSIKSGGLLICDNAISHSYELKPFITKIKSNSIFTCSTVPVGKGEFIAVKA